MKLLIFNLLHLLYRVHSVHTIKQIPRQKMTAPLFGLPARHPILERQIVIVKMKMGILKNATEKKKEEMGDALQPTSGLAQWRVCLVG